MEDQKGTRQLRSKGSDLLKTSEHICLAKIINVEQTKGAYFGTNFVRRVPLISTPDTTLQKASADQS
jgi:hypothetical protein